MSVKLTRAERTQARRATTRLLTLEKREFESSSSSATYVARIMIDGKFQCDCRGWTIKRIYRPRWCKHCETLCAGRETVIGAAEDADYRFLKSAFDAFIAADKAAEERENAFAQSFPVVN